VLLAVGGYLVGKSAPRRTGILDAADADSPTRRRALPLYATCSERATSVDPAITPGRWVKSGSLDHARTRLEVRPSRTTSTGDRCLLFPVSSRTRLTSVVSSPSRWLANATCWATIARFLVVNTALFRRGVATPSTFRGVFRLAATAKPPARPPSAAPPAIMGVFRFFAVLPTFFAVLSAVWPADRAPLVTDLLAVSTRPTPLDALPERFDAADGLVRALRGELLRRVFPFDVAALRRLVVRPCAIVLLPSTVDLVVRTSRALMRASGRAKRSLRALLPDGRPEFSPTCELLANHLP
jgi:hypothetical protein